MANLRKIEATVPAMPEKKKVAAYARVSMESERMLHSLSAQISYYSDLIQSNPDWEYVGVYADGFISGTGTAKRDEFNRMLADCEVGKIDIILVKSISRFARNTVDLLQTVRHLKELGVEVRFEKECINSMSGDGELMLTILASFAQEESRSISENVKWGTVKRFQEGIPNGRFRIYGYRWDGDHLVIEPEEAAVVRRIFRNFLDGKSRLETAEELNTGGITTKRGYPWVDSNVKVVLTNVTYTGNMLLQKEFIEDPITKKRRKNHGELPQYWVENTHEPIIDMETFRYVQDEMARRRELGAIANKAINTTCFTGKIKCPYCRRSYVHDIRNSRDENCKAAEAWECGSRKKADGHCPVSGAINQDVMEEVVADVLGTEKFDEQVFLEKVDVIYVPESYTLEIHLTDGRTVTRECRSTGHKDCWTEEYRARVSEYRRNHPIDRKDYTVFTSKIRCAECGRNFRKQTDHRSDGGTVVYWRCSAPKSTCGTPSLREDALKQMTAEVLGIDDFDDSVFLDRVSYISADSASRLTFHFTDGSIAARQWEKPKRVMPAWTEERRSKLSQTAKDNMTEERRQAMSENMKRIREERGSSWYKEK